MFDLNDESGFLGISTMRIISNAANEMMKICGEPQESMTFWHWYLLRDDAFGQEIRSTGRMGSVKPQLPTRID